MGAGHLEGACPLEVAEEEDLPFQEGAGEEGDHPFLDYFQINFHGQ